MSDEQVPQANANGWTDLRIEIIIGTLLRSGVILSAAVILFGAVLYLAHHGHEIPNYTAFHGEPESLKSPIEILQGVMHMSARAIIQFGLLLLIATPVARVLFSAIAFALERDVMYVVITLIVLAVLLFSLFGLI
ncbi:MAG TPA: DUF1634 domain-containing protein [Verrucomicrobiae bacterium]|jgi:uncharacterized membrane protein|nr:DUF1634 domain-containing protein [Verrucomicrobiae bacterium]